MANTLTLNKKKTFTRKEVTSILLSVLVYSGANNNQGLSTVSGDNYGQQAEQIIQANESTTNIMLAVQKFRSL